MRKKTRPYLWVVLGGFLTPTADAHVKWFIDAGSVAPNTGLAYHLTDPAVQIWIGALAAGLILAYLLNRVTPRPPHFLIQQGAKFPGQFVHLFQLVVGISLIATAYRGAILAPHLKDNATFALALRGIEALVGALFVTNVLVFAGAVLLLMLYVASTAVFGFLMSLEYFNLLGIAVFLFFIKSPKGFGIDRHCVWALPLLRMHTGVALSVLAFSEKLMRPELAMAFLAKHDINFMKKLGFASFGDHLFVLSAGFSELLFGLIFLFGLITRVNTVALACFLTASNVYFFWLGKSTEGVLEVIGHASLFAIGLILVLYGSGRRIRLPSGRRLICHGEREDWKGLADFDDFHCEPWCRDEVRV